MSGFLYSIAASSGYETLTQKWLDATQNLFGDMTFYQFNKILSGACAAFAVVVMLAFMLMHATHFSKPNEQLK